MKEVKNKDKNRRSCCERYVTDYMLGKINIEHIISKMKINPQLRMLVDNKLNKTRRELVNIPVELWAYDNYEDCVSYLLTVNEKYAHIAQYINTVHKGRAKNEKLVSLDCFRNHKVKFDYNDDTGVLIADFFEDGIRIRSIKNNVIDININ